MASQQESHKVINQQGDLDIFLLSHAYINHSYIPKTNKRLHKCAQLKSNSRRYVPLLLLTLALLGTRPNRSNAYP
jgi:hypothetical protein